jgi:hypothetical protein
MGTAQFWRDGEKDNHTWFIAFAPYESPKIAMAVLVQGAKAGGQVPAPIAAKIIEEILALTEATTLACRRSLLRLETSILSNQSISETLLCTPNRLPQTKKRQRLYLAR